MKKMPPIGNHWKEIVERYKYVCVVILVGLFLLLLPTNGEVEKTEVNEGKERNVYNLLEFEQHLAEKLGLIDGVGKTEVVLTLKTTGEKVYAKDVTEEYGGKNSSNIVVIGSGSSEKVVEVQEYYPEFQGALIICKGGDNPSVKLQLIQAVSGLTGLNSHQITVCKSEK